MITNIIHTYTQTYTQTEQSMGARCVKKIRLDDSGIERGEGPKFISFEWVDSTLSLAAQNFLKVKSHGRQVVDTSDSFLDSC